MQEILFDYELNPATWAYLSSLLTIGVYFKFGRFWSVRNLDLVALIAFAPALVLLYYGLKRQMGAVDPFGQSLELLGYIWLFCVGAFFLIRLLLDPLMVRRPLLEPNLSAGGLTFTCVALGIILMANVVTTQRAERLEDVFPTPPVQHGPGYPYFYHFARFSEGTVDSRERVPPAGSATQREPGVAAEAASVRGERVPMEPSPGVEKASQTNRPTHISPETYRRARTRDVTRRIAAILAHLAVVVAVVLVGYRHFDNIHAGVAVASLYLLVFYTSQMVGRVDHVVPAALLVWGVQCYRRPLLSGLLIGLAGGLIYYPLFLLPLWCGFYWRRGLIRFAFGAACALGLLVLLVAFTPDSLGTFSGQLAQTFGWMNPLKATLYGFWQSHEQVFRIPVLAAYVALCAGLALWPAQKNLGTLLSCSAAVMLGSQFWQAYQGGIYMAWYLPLLLLTVFRPNLEDRVALSAVAERWLWKRRPRPAANAQAAPAPGEAPR